MTKYGKSVYHASSKSVTRRPQTQGRTRRFDTKMSKRFALLIATTGVMACTGALVLAGAAGAASSSRPTLKIALAGKTGISVSGSEVSGAVNVVSTFTGKGQGAFALVRLNPGVTFQQAFQAVQSHRGDENALTPYGAVTASANAPGSIQTVLTRGNWVALNVSGMGAPGFAQFTVTKASSPAALPAAKATETSIEFGFKGPKVLTNGTVVRAQNGGYLVHMIDLIGLRSKAVAPKVMSMLRAGAPQKAFRPYLSGQFVSLLDPASPGAQQQIVLHAKPGYYVEACFMDTQDGREHTRLGMERLVRVVK